MDIAGECGESGGAGGGGGEGDGCDEGDESAWSVPRVVTRLTDLGRPPLSTLRGTTVTTASHSPWLFWRFWRLTSASDGGIGVEGGQAARVVVPVLAAVVETRHQKSRRVKIRTEGVQLVPASEIDCGDTQARRGTCMQWARTGTLCTQTAHRERLLPSPETVTRNRGE